MSVFDSEKYSVVSPYAGIASKFIYTQMAPIAIFDISDKAVISVSVRLIFLFENIALMLVVFIFHPHVLMRYLTM